MDADVQIREEALAERGVIRALVARAFADAEHRAPSVDPDGVPGEATLVGWLRESSAYDRRFALVAVEPAVGEVAVEEAFAGEVAVGEAFAGEVAVEEPFAGELPAAARVKPRGASDRTCGLPGSVMPSAGVERVVGFVIASWGDVGSVPMLGVGPLAVEPKWQGRGVGAALMRELLARVEAAGERVVVLLGDPAYYSRFGFVSASSLGIVADPAWGDFFQARVVGSEGPLPTGTFTYAEPFSRLG